MVINFINFVNIFVLQCNLLPFMFFDIWMGEGKAVGFYLVSIYLQTLKMLIFVKSRTVNLF